MSIDNIMLTIIGATADDMRQSKHDIRKHPNEGKSRAIPPRNSQDPEDPDAIDGLS
jgi:hypothetical protein